jgi:hypothetical protein
MKRLLILVCGAAVAVACSREPASLSIPTGSQVSVEKSDGVKVEGKLVEVTSDRVIVEQASGQRTTVQRGDINAIRAANLPSPSASAGAAENPRTAESGQPVGSTGGSSAVSNPIGKTSGSNEHFRELTIPAGTVLPVDLETSVGSDISHAEQPVRGALRRAIMINGVQVLPAGTAVYGHVTTAQRPGKVKGRGLIAMRFNEVDTPGSGRERMTTATISRMAPATKQKDALEILAPAAGGAVIGRVVGGHKGAAEGALIGGGAGTAYVLTTRGKEIRLGKGANLSVRLTQPLTVRVPAR